MTTNVSSTSLLHSLGGCGAVLRALISNYSIYRFATIGLVGDPLQLLELPHSTCPEKGGRISSKQNSQQTDDVVNCHGCSLLEFFVFFQMFLDDLNGML